MAKTLCHAIQLRCSGLASYKANYFTNHVFVVSFKSVAVYIVAYVEIVRIPEGAMHIRISESQLSKNYLGKYGPCFTFGADS